MGGKHRHVRRLKISDFMTAEDEDIAVKMGQHRQEENMYEEKSDEWINRHYFHVHDFCRPSHEDMWYGACSIQEPHSESWNLLAHFIGTFTGLRDLVWAAGWCIPPSVLPVSAERRIRLHVHHFYLPSLVQERDPPKPVSAYDYTLCTLPSLYSISFRASPLVPGGRVNYTQEAVMQMVAGLAPNLAHVCVVPTTGSGELDPGLDRTYLLGRPDWKGFFPGQITSTQELENVTACSSSSSQGKLQTLVFPMNVPDGIDHWARHTDFSCLRSFSMPWTHRDGIALAAIASQGKFKSLKKLHLYNIDQYDTAQQAEVNFLFSSCSPLERLDINTSAPRPSTS